MEEALFKMPHVHLVNFLLALEIVQSKSGITDENIDTLKDDMRLG